MLSLFKDETYINERFKNCLTETKVLDWKYENAVRQILDLGFQPYDVEMDLKKLGAMYKFLVYDIKHRHLAIYSEAENQKITNIIEHLGFTLLKNKRRRKRLLKKKIFFDKLHISEKFAHLAKYYGVVLQILDLQKNNIPRRFFKHMRKMKEELGLLLQPLVTLEEREMLVEISSCQNTTEIQELVTTWYSKFDLSSNCRFIRFALVAGLELWNSKALTKKGHGEDWFRMHVYSNVWDKAFFDDDEFETKRSECLSQVMKLLKENNGDTKLQKLDFILRDLNTNNDVITAEEKPTLKGMKADVKKGGLLKKNTLYLWSKQVKSHVLMKELESISCQWQGTKLTIYGSRLLSSDLILTYVKGSFHVPVSASHLPEFSKLLMAVISLKRMAKLNYAKFTLILEEKYKQEIENLMFDHDPLDGMSFVSDSTDSNQKSEYDIEDFVENTLAKVKNLKVGEEGLKRFSDWEELLLFDRVKCRKISR
ncbi:uncharacterized protein BX663DRAFT_530378 [Cokeromyces recurvatus]|uniref:uncharacterized protein n=1 Tax=Cokeromyces recurvatus TaxID=90255 RepID=UPI0022201E2F|nr:uncharacterized protein BX663DRAFT_530378 [Cokeromyces recurvatus]KAI7904274.1 hypothetical protein BX663DRAFT_530378 [Cokeromyces recurvatus]